MIIKDLGAVTAYAYAVEKGYTGTEEEFATLMASYASVAEEAAESAEYAQASATTASSAASTATTKASEATTAAQTATAKAEEAQADADAAALDASQALSAASTATSKASEAAQSASDAVTAKTAAQTAQTAAEGSATTAQTAAQTATQKAAEAAESARTLTIDTTLTQNGQAADAKKTGDEISTLKEEISDISTVIEQSVDITTIANTYISINGSSQSGAYHAEIPVIKGEKYKIKSSDGSSIRAYVMMSGGSVVEYYNVVDSWATLHDYDIEYTVPQDGTLCINSIDNLYIGAKKVELVPLCKTNSDKNTKARTNALQLNESKNLYNGEYITGGYRAGKTINTSIGEFCYSKPIFLEAGTYLYTTTYQTFGSAGCVVYVVDAGGGIYTTSNNISTTSIGTVSEYQKYNNRRIDSFTLSKDCYVSFNLGRPTSYIYEDQVNNFMLVKGSTLADFPHYEPYFTPFYSVKNEAINGLSGLRGKIAIFDGDSICQGSSVGTSEPTYLYGYAGRVCKANNMIWKNYGVSGGCITSATNSSIDSSRHSVVDNIDTLYEQFPDADFIIFEGGTNDADLLGNAIADPTKMGTFTENDYAGTYDITTFSGALETLFYKAIQYWSGKKIGFIVAQKMGVSYSNFDKNHANRRAYFERAIEICSKWGVPCLNLWDGCYLNPRNASCYNSDLDADGNRTQGYLYIDGQHLTAKGYDYISPIIENWMKSL